MKNKKHSFKNYILLVIIVMLIITNFVSIYLLVRYNKILEICKNEPSNELLNTIKVIENIDKYYNEYYVSDINYKDLDLKIGNALIQSYGDEYGVYLSPEKTKEQLLEMNGTLYGIGVLVRAELTDGDDKLYIINSFEESSAKELGLIKGCYITAVNGEGFDLNTQSYTDLINSIKGEEGTTVNITFIDNNNVERTLDFERRKIDINTVDYEIINNVGYISIREFSNTTYKEFSNAMRELSKQGISKFIFDLRDNPGGYLDAVINMLDILLPYGDILKIVDSNNNITKTYTSDKNCYTFESVCIINNESASASELFVQNLKDFGLTTIIGEQSYGKGTVCTQYIMPNGGLIQVSTHRYLTHSDMNIEDVGVTPDIQIKLSAEKEKISYKLDKYDDDLIMKALEILN